MGCTMPMVVYTEEDMIVACDKAAPVAVRDVAAQRDHAMRENTAFRRVINDLRDGLQSIAGRNGDLSGKDAEHFVWEVQLLLKRTAMGSSNG